MKSSFHPDWVFKFLLINILNLGIYMIAFYVLKHIQIPQFFDRKRYVLFVMSIMGTSVMMYVIWRLNGLWWIDEMKGVNYYKPYGNMVDFLTQTVQFYSPSILLLVLDSMDERRLEKERLAQLEKEKLQTELKYLKAQLNPHFLFNTLNNLYSFVVNNSPKAPEMILNLSAMLDYILYKSQKEKVSLSEEVEAIKTFINLEQNRYGERLKVDININGNMTTPISPLLLLSTVENAFKHGASGNLENPKIKIEIEENAGIVKCNVWNTKSQFNGEKNDSYKKGIGLTNIQRQLALVYPDNHALEITDGKLSYNVTIQLNALK